MATQVSPETSPPYIPPPVEGQGGNHHSTRVEVRDVEVDKGATMKKRSKRHRMRMKNNNRLPDANDLSLIWNTTEGAMKLSKLQKEEARITAWENLQNAKAEASIRKLEVCFVNCLLAKLREYKSDLTQLKRELKKLASAISSQTAHEELLESGMANSHMASAHQKYRLMMSTERLNQSSERIEDRIAGELCLKQRNLVSQFFKICINNEKLF